MKFIYRLSKENKIESYADVSNWDALDIEASIKEGYILTEREIIKNADNHFVFEDEIDVEKDNQLKAEKALLEAKAHHKASLKAERDTLASSPIESNGHLFDYDEAARTHIAGAIHLMTTTGLPTVEWTLADNAKVDVSVEDLDAVKLAAEMRFADLHTRYGLAKVALENCKTLEEVEKVVL